MTNSNRTATFTVEIEELTLCLHCQSEVLQIWRQSYARLNELSQQKSSALALGDRFDILCEK